MVVTADMPETFRARLKIVRLDSFAELPGLIIHVDEINGNVLMKVPSSMGMKKWALSPGSFRIMLRR